MKACLKEQINQIVCTWANSVNCMSSPKLALIAKKRTSFFLLRKFKHAAFFACLLLTLKINLSSPVYLFYPLFVVDYHPNHHSGLPSLVTDGMLAAGDKVANCYLLTSLTSLNPCNSYSLTFRLSSKYIKKLWGLAF